MCRASRRPSTPGRPATRIDGYLFGRPAIRSNRWGRSLRATNPRPRARPGVPVCPCGSGVHHRHADLRRVDRMARVGRVYAATAFHTHAPRQSALSRACRSDVCHSWTGIRINDMPLLDHLETEADLDAYVGAQRRRYWPVPESRRGRAGPRRRRARWDRRSCCASRARCPLRVRGAGSSRPHGSPHHPHDRRSMTLARPLSP